MIFLFSILKISTGHSRVSYLNQKRVISFMQELVKVDASEQIKKFQHMEQRRVPEDIDYDAMPALSSEVKEKLKKVRPISLGQASRIPGVTPAAITALMSYLEHRKRVGKGTS